MKRGYFENYDSFILNEIKNHKDRTIFYQYMDSEAVPENYLNMTVWKFDPFLIEKKMPPQPVISINGETNYRLRTELIVINDDDKILIDLARDRGFGYDLPGGGIDEDEEIEHAAKRECEEEALVIPKNVKFVNIAYFTKYIPKRTYNGAVTLICVGKYDKPYKGYVRKIDRSNFVNRSIWKRYDKIKLGEPHRLAIERYLDMEGMK